MTRQRRPVRPRGPAKTRCSPRRAPPTSPGRDCAAPARTGHLGAARQGRPRL